MTMQERFDAKMMPEPNSGCWLWLAAASSLGYGYFFDGKLKLAHRVSYEMHVGPIPDGLDLDHLCRNPSCVNPDHLEPVTRKENINRGIVAQVHRVRYAKITHCPQGHAYDEKNTYRHPKGCRICRTCQRERMRRARS